MATIVRKDDKIHIPNDEIIAITATIQLGKPTVRVICKNFDYFGREVILNKTNK